MEANEEEKLKLFQERYKSCDRYLELKLDSKSNEEEIEKERKFYVEKAKEVTEKYSEVEYTKFILARRSEVQ